MAATVMSPDWSGVGRITETEIGVHSEVLEAHEPKQVRH